MSSPRFAELAARALARITSREPEPPSASERASAVEAIARAMRARGRKRRLVRIAASAVGVAALAAAALLLVRAQRARPEILVAAPDPEASRIVVGPTGTASAEGDEPLAPPSSLAPPPARSAQRVASPHARAPASAPHASTSTLASQNALYAEALAQKRSGDAPGALATFEQFLAAYPQSPLAESAAAQRMKLLRSMDPPRAVLAARAYLRDYPDGIARTDAEAILGGP